MHLNSSLRPACVFAHTHAADSGHQAHEPHVGHGHSHGGGGGHSHHPLPSNDNWKRLAAVLVLTALFMVVEALAGWWTHSLTLLSDAGHMLTDVGALGLALFAVWFSRRAAPLGLTFGYLRFEILAALVNGIALLGITGYIFIEAIQRFQNPEPVQAGQMMVVAVLGLIVNLVSLAVLSRGGGHSLNERGAILHIIGDILGSVGAIVAAGIIRFTGWYRVDSIVSALIGLLILRSTWELLREAVNILMEGTPVRLSFAELHDAMVSVQGVSEVKDLHVWCLASGFDALSAHVVVPEVERTDEVRSELKRLLRTRYGIEHSTLEVERPGDTPECPPGMPGRCRAFPRPRQPEAHEH